MAAELRGGKLLGTMTAVHSKIAVIDIGRKTKAMTALINELRPDLVHAMRLPFEGYLAAAAVKTSPLLISIWGNDFTLFADRSRQLGELTNAALQRVDGLHCDCRRDLKTALARGFSQAKPWRVLPGNGGVQTGLYFKLQPDPAFLRKFGIPQGVPLVVNPRGFRAYVRNDTFFRAIPLVLKQFPKAFFATTAMAGNPVAERWTHRMNVGNSVRLLPFLSREELASLFASAEISVSPSSHDGTPNTLLEAMACGSFPVVGNVSSLHEWIAHEENGLFCDETDADSIAGCLIRALGDENLRAQAAEINRNLVRTRAEYSSVMSEAESLYKEVLLRRQAATNLSSSKAYYGVSLAEARNLQRVGQIP